MIIKSLFDDDLYKFTMQQAVLKLYPNAEAEYRFRNRGVHKFDESVLSGIQDGINELAELKPEKDELEWFASHNFIEPWYAKFLEGYRYSPKQVNFSLTENNDLDLRIKDPWWSTILWEVKLMAIISEAYFSAHKDEWTMAGQKEKLQLKTNKLASAQCQYADFGTRRRRNFEIQDLVVSTFQNYFHFSGTSNVHLAYKYGLKPIGTMAHEWVQGVSAMESLNHANRFMLKAWTDVYDGKLGIALTDTYGTDSFFRDFSLKYAALFAGVRHDSGDPFIFADKVVAHYKKLGLDPRTKVIVFSDGLTADKAVEIQEHCNVIGIPCSFGIGTSFTNDFDNSPALNMVIKLFYLDGHPIVKLSDVPSKANGEPKAVEMMRFMYGF